MDDSEAVDWGNEEEEREMDEDEHREFAAEDAEDAVSLGGDEDDEFLTYQSRQQQGTKQGGQTPPRSAHNPDNLEHQESTTRGRRSDRQRSNTPHKSRLGSQSASDASPLLKRAQSFGKLTHALPPKPVVSSVPFVHPSHPSIIEATAMSTRLDHDKRGNGSASKSHGHDSTDLPPEWEIKHPKSGRGVYYYNSRTQESTWIRPASTTPSASARDKDKERSHTADVYIPEELLGNPISAAKGLEPAIARTSRPDTDKDMSYGDRHYRPGEGAPREEKPTSTRQVRDTYIPARSLSPPPRHLEEDHSQLSRRPSSPALSFTDRDRARPPRRDGPRTAPSIPDDRYWTSQESAPIDRPTALRERRRDTEHRPLSNEREWRDSPRDSDKSPTLRPRSPGIYTRDGQHPVLHSPSSMPVPSTSLRTGVGSSTALRHKSRFSQAVSPTETGRHIPEEIERKLADVRARLTESSAEEHASSLPKAPHREDTHETSRSASDDRMPIREERSVSPKQSPATDSQHQRKRAPLPPQSAIFSRQVPQKPDAGYSPYHPAIVPAESGLPPKPVTSNANIPSGPRISPLNPPRDASDRPRPARAPPSGPASGMKSRVVDTYVPTETAKARDKDILDTDGLPSATTSTKSFEPPSRSGYVPPDDQGDSLPKGPRAMAGRNIQANADAHVNVNRPGLERSRSSRNDREVRYNTSSVNDHPRRFERAPSPASDSLRRPPAAAEPTRAYGNREPPRDQGKRVWEQGPHANSMRTSGANGIPIGDRPNRFSSSASASESPHPPKLSPLVAESRSQPPWTSTTDTSGSQAPHRSNSVKEKYERSPRTELPDATHRASGVGRPTATDQIQHAHRLISPTLPRRPISPDGKAASSFTPGSARHARGGHGVSRFGPPIQRPELEPSSTPRKSSPDILRTSPRYHHERLPSPPVSRDPVILSTHDLPLHRHQPRTRSPVRRPDSPPPRDQRVAYAPPHTDEYEGARRFEEHYDGRPRENERVPAFPPNGRTPNHRENRYDEGPPAHNMMPPASNRRPPEIYSNERPRQNFQDSRSAQYVADEDQGHSRRESPPRKVHPERELLLQSSYAAHPRADHSSGLPRGGRAPRHSDMEQPPYKRPEENTSRSDRSSDFERRSDDYPGNRYRTQANRTISRDDHALPGHRTSLLDRLSLDDPATSPALRDRVDLPIQLPVKRDRDEMVDDAEAMLVDDDDFDGSKRARRRVGKPRRPRHIA